MHTNKFGMHTKTVFYMHAKHVCIIYTPKSIFAYQYHKFFFFLAYYLYTFSWDQALHFLGIIWQTQRLKEEQLFEI